METIEQRAKRLRKHHKEAGTLDLQPCATGIDPSDHKAIAARYREVAAEETRSSHKQTLLQAAARQDQQAAALELTEEDIFGEVISRYTRADALADGVLIDVSKMAKEAGFKVPVAITNGVMADVKDIPKSKQGIQDVEGRMWDLLYMASQAARNTSGRRSRSPEKLFQLHMHIGRYKLYTAKMHIGPGDAGEPVITILRPEED